jgi:hypothetical protein
VKKLIIAAGLLVTLQALVVQTERSKKKHEPAYADFVYVTPNTNTLYLSLENRMSEMTRLSWVSDPKLTGSNTIIVMVS